MSRRCDREGVAWPRRGMRDRSALRWGWSTDELDLLTRHFNLWVPRVLVRKRHPQAMAHLRERPTLPPWWTQEMIDRAHALAAKWEKIFLDAEDEGSSDGATVAGERGSRG